MSGVNDPLLLLVPNRAESLLRRVREQVWHSRQALPVQATTPSARHRTWAELDNPQTRRVAEGGAWGRLYDQRWFKVTLPRLSQGAGPWYLEWRDQGEATLYAQGIPVYGFDVAHRYAPLPRGAAEVWIEAYCCQTAIWHPEATGLSAEGSVFTGAYAVQRNDVAWAAWHDLQVLFDLLVHLRGEQKPYPGPLCRFGLQPGVEQAAPVYRKLLHWLAQAADAYDVKGLAELGAVLRRAFEDLRQAKPFTAATLTGHAHIDLVWLWPERIGEAKAVHTFATVTSLMERYPEFRFAYSQPASYRAVARRSPALARAVTRRVRSGQWQPTGALEVESDTTLPCGEALARSFLLGQEEFVRLRGEPSPLLWLPDVFGYSGCLPQLMKLAGVKWFFTTKLTWSAVTRFPYSSFRWRGVDGSEVLTHVTQDVGYNNRLDVAELEANAQGHAQSHLTPEFLHPTGYGDGGGGPTEEMCERARRLTQLAGLPEVRWGHPEEFFARLEAERERLPEYQGECYLEYHRGTYTTHGELKAAFRGLERALQLREAAAVVRGEKVDLREPWRRLIFAQFHDYIPGSSVAKVYAEGVPELLQRARALQTETETRLGSSGERRWFNPLPVAWSGWVRASTREGWQWVDVGPLASAQSGAAPEDRVHCEEGTLRNARVALTVNEAGDLSRLCVDGREVELSAAAEWILYPDNPANYDAWDIDRHSLALGQKVETPVERRVERDARGAALVVKRRVGQRSELVLRYRLLAGEAVVRLEADLDWREEKTLLRWEVPTGYSAEQARFGAPFGSTLRRQWPGPLAQEAQWEVPGSRWAAVFHEGEREGLAVCTEAKYGFSARRGRLTLSLLRSAKVTGCDDDHRYAAPRGLSRYQPTSSYTDQGKHHIEWCLCAYGSPRQAEHPAALAERLYTPLVAFSGAAVLSVWQGWRETDSTLLPVWAQPLEAGRWILRCHEIAGRAGVVTPLLGPGTTLRRCTLAGLPGDAAFAGQVRYRPYEIVSLLVEEAPLPSENRPRKVLRHKSVRR